MADHKNNVEKVWNNLNEDPCIRIDLKRGLINVRALAKYLIKERKIDSTLDAVISAIRRYKVDAYDNIFENARRMTIKTTTISTKSPLVNISVLKDTEVQTILPRLFSIIHYNLGDVLRIIQGDGSIKIFVDEKNLEKVTALFPEKSVINIIQGLGEISVHMHPDGRYVPGILALSATKLATNGVNIMEAMSCFPEWLWFVEEKDLQKAYTILYKLWKTKC